MADRDDLVIKGATGDPPVCDDAVVGGPPGAPVRFQETGMPA